MRVCERWQQQQIVAAQNNPARGAMSSRSGCFVPSGSYSERGPLVNCHAQERSTTSNHPRWRSPRQSGGRYNRHEALRGALQRKVRTELYWSVSATHLQSACTYLQLRGGPVQISSVDSLVAYTVYDRILLSIDIQHRTQRFRPCHQHQRVQV